jgi:hypothetical protein
MVKTKTKPVNRIAKIQTNHAKIKLDLSYGDLPEGSGFSKEKGLDPDRTPWNLKDESVEEAYCAFRFNRVPGTERMAWMAELWRVLVPSGKCTMIVPYWASPRSIQDPMSAWPPICEQSFLYFNKGFREGNKLPEPKGYCDFDFSYGYQLDRNDAAVINGKSDEVRSFWIKHYINIIEDLHMVLTKRPRT